MYRITIVQILAIVSLVSAQTQTAIVNYNQASEQEKIDVGRATWNSKIFSNYEYEFSQACTNCHTGNYPWTVQITPGQPAAAINSKNQLGVGAMSIAQVFDKIQGHINNPNDQVEAYYDAINGYPTRYKIQVGGTGDIVSSSIYNFQTLDADQKKLYQNARNLWESQRLNDYDFQYYDLGPNTQNIQWPIFIKVRGGRVAEQKDNNGNHICWSAWHLMTIIGWFDQIKKQLDSGVPYMDTVYNGGNGHPEDILTITYTNQATVDFAIRNFRTGPLEPAEASPCK